MSQVNQKADKGRKVVEQTVEAMDRIQKSSEDVSQILSLIDDIAFQTNLLALNAGVEAARAGSAGNGFAVVAAEVRALAQRTGTAAQDIKELMDTSARHVSEGAQLANDTTDALSEISHVVGEANNAVLDIAKAMEKQATNIADMTRSVRELDNLTQQNAVMAEETSAASSELKSDAQVLEETARVFLTLNTDSPKVTELQRAS